MYTVDYQEGDANDGITDYHEAPYVIKRDGVYGVILDPESSDTSHASIAEFKDKWYMFYHTKDLSGNGALRSIHADELTFADDGSINKVVQTDGSDLLIGERIEETQPDVVCEAEDAELTNEKSTIKPEANKTMSLDKIELRYLD